MSMKVFVLYDKNGIHSGRALGQELQKRWRRDVLVEKGRPSRLDLLQRQGRRYDYIVNVGWYQDISPRGATVLNPPSGIRESSNKRGARIKFRQMEIPAPELWLAHTNVSQSALPVVGRTTHHMKGRGFWFCRTLDDVRRAHHAGATHFMKFVPDTREFRVHLMAPQHNLEDLEGDDYRVIKLSEKLPGPRGVRNDRIKNHGNGWVFGYPNNRKDPALKAARSAGRKALHPFDLHWGAVDIMISRNTGQAFVLEVNSSPCLTDDNATTLAKYAEGLDFLIGMRQPEARERGRKATPPKKRVDPHLRSILGRSHL